MVARQLLQAKMMERQARNAAAGAADSATSAAASASSGKKKGKGASPQDEDDSDAGSDADAGAASSQDPGAKEKVQVWDFLDDLMEGFAEIYKMTVGAGHQCNDCIRKTSFPIKERIVSFTDDVQAAMNPSAESRTARGEFAAAPTFSHE
mmetsp:Transcript_8512/g.24029  ORF Transcript_8512/g.24029 Transcript_8512/m.24029 type:complete len:150 (-) Transcript_8512:153-602(-)